MANKKSVMIKTGKNIFEGAVAVVIGILLAWMINARNVHFVNGESMEPTLHDGQIVYVEDAKDMQLEKGMIVIAAAPDGNTIIKRVIGCPEDTIALDADGKVVINGEKEQRGFDSIFREREGNLESGMIVRLSGNDYYLMGDNRNYSTDSRVYGAFDKSKILYVVKKIIW